MPQFRPSALATNTVQFTQQQKDSFIHLTFFATLDSDAQQHGHCEIWTDLPFLDEQGKPSPAGWKSKTFQPVRQECEAETHLVNVNGHSASRSITIKTKKSAKSAPSPPVTFSLTAVIPATSTDQSYSYTFRDVNPDGSLQWHSEMGMNGIINTKVVDYKPDNKDIKTSSEYPTGMGTMGEDDWDFEGSGITLRESKDRAVKPVLISPVTHSNASTTIALLHGPSTPHLSSFSQISPTRLPLPAQRATSYLAIIGQINNPLKFSGQLPLNGVHGHPAGFALGYDTAPSKVLSEAIKVTAGDQSHLFAGEVKDGGAVSQDVGALYYIPRQSLPENVYLIIDAVHSESPRDVQISLPDTIPHSSPLAILSNSAPGAFYIPSSAKGSPREIPVQIEAGESTEVLQIAEFFELRGEGGNDSFWVCVPHAISVEIGEEEIQKHQSIVIEYFEYPKSTDADSPDLIGSNGFKTPLPKSTEIIESAENSQAPEQDNAVLGKKATSSTWWILSMFSPFFSGIWNILMSPFGSSKTIKPTDIPEGDVMPKIDERTRLIGDHTDSYASVSTTETFQNKSSTRPHQSPIAPLPHTVSIRSYAIITFPLGSPAKIYFPPGTDQIDERLKFSGRKDASEEWVEIVTVVKQGEGIVEVESEGEVEGECQVQIERV